MYKRRVSDNESKIWAAVSDAMLGFSGIIILILILSFIKIQAEKEGKTTLEDLNANEYFKIGEYRLDFSNPQVKIKLTNIAYKIKETIDKARSKNKSIKIAIVGHTDSRPVVGKINYEANWQLSVLRAWSILDFFLSLDFMKDYKNYLFIEGFADTELFDKDDPYSYKNRRIEIVIYYNYKKPE